MPHDTGAHLDGVNSVESLRWRCVCDAHTGCWHLRTANGKAIGEGEHGRLRVWVYGHGKMTATRAAWMLQHGKMPAPGLVVRRTCDSHDCANPAHMAAVTRATLAKRNAIRPGEANAAQLAALRARAERVRKITPELKLWLVESAQSTYDAAHGLGVSQSVAAAHRRAYVPASVFALGHSAAGARA